MIKSGLIDAVEKPPEVERDGFWNIPSQIILSIPVFFEISNYLINLQLMPRYFTDCRGLT